MSGCGNLGMTHGADRFQRGRFNYLASCLWDMTGSLINLSGSTIVNKPASANPFVVLSKAKGVSEPSDVGVEYTNPDYVDYTTAYTHADWRPVITSSATSGGALSGFFTPDLTNGGTAYSWDSVNQVLTINEEGVYLFSIDMTVRLEVPVVQTPVVSIGLGINKDANNLDQTPPQPDILTGAGMEVETNYAEISVTCVRFYTAGTTLRLYMAEHNSLSATSSDIIIGPASGHVVRL